MIRFQFLQARSRPDVIQPALQALGQHPGNPRHRIAKLAFDMITHVDRLPDSESQSTLTSRLDVSPSPEVLLKLHYGLTDSLDGRVFLNVIARVTEKLEDEKQDIEVSPASRLRVLTHFATAQSLYDTPVNGGDALGQWLRPQSPEMP